MNTDKITTVVGWLIATVAGLATFHVVPVEVATGIGSVLTAIFAYFTNKPNTN